MINLKKYDNTPISGLLQLSDIESSDTPIGQYGCDLQLPDGTMILCGQSIIGAGLRGIVVNFKYDFLRPPVLVSAALYVSDIDTVSVTTQPTVSNCEIIALSNTEKATKIRIVNWIAIGRWK